MAGRLFINAVNVHQGGGGVLLAALLAAIPNDVDAICFLDERMQVDEKIAQSICIKKIKPSIVRRFKAETQLRNEVRTGDVVLCFGNLPPLFKSKGHVSVFIQNRYLLSDASLKNFPLHVALRIMLERLWLGKKFCNANELIVQTPSMLTLLAERINNQLPIRTFPFISDPKIYSRGVSPTPSKSSKYLYVASGEPHKNHHVLIDAWRILANEGIFPALQLTLDKSKFHVLTALIDKAVKDDGVQIENFGEVSSATVKNLYQQADALIYPSVFESFGLPLIEARQAGLDVLASELDYVRDVLDPEQTFNPNSAISIAQAVKRHMGLNEPALPLKSAAEFMQYILAKRT